MDERYPDGIKHPRKQDLPQSLVPYLTGPRWRSLSVLIIIFVISVVIVFNYTRIDRIESLLDKQEIIWNNSQISNYEFSLIKGAGEGFYSGKIQVRNGEVVDVISLNGDESYWKPYKSTISKLFDDVLNYARKFQGYSIDIEFHEEFGFPEQAIIGMDFTSSFNYIRISDFKVLDD